MCTHHLNRINSSDRSTLSLKRTLPRVIPLKISDPRHSIPMDNIMIRKVIQMECILLLCWGKIHLVLVKWMVGPFSEAWAVIFGVFWDVCVVFILVQSEPISVTRVLAKDSVFGEGISVFLERKIDWRVDVGDYLLKISIFSSHVVVFAKN